MGTAFVTFALAGLWIVALIQGVVICLIYYQSFRSDAEPEHEAKQTQGYFVRAGDALPPVSVTRPATGEETMVNQLVQGITVFLFVLPTCGICDRTIQRLALSSTERLPKRVNIVCFGADTSCDCYLDLERIDNAFVFVGQQASSVLGDADHHLLLIADGHGIVLSVTQAANADTIIDALCSFGASEHVNSGERHAD